ncbi:hypothetical protein J6590_072235, partial [Homalodisca vitripennis]
FLKGIVVALRNLDSLLLWEPLQTSYLYDTVENRVAEKPDSLLLWLFRLLIYTALWGIVAQRTLDSLFLWEPLQTSYLYGTVGNRGAENP